MYYQPAIKVSKLNFASVEQQQKLNRHKCELNWMGSNGMVQSKVHLPELEKFFRVGEQMCRKIVQKESEKRNVHETTHFCVFYFKFLQSSRHIYWSEQNIMFHEYSTNVCLVCEIWEKNCTGWSEVGSQIIVHFVFSVWPLSYKPVLQSESYFLSLFFKINPHWANAKSASFFDISVCPLSSHCNWK